MAAAPTGHVNPKMEVVALPTSTPSRSTATYTADAQSPSGRWFLSVPGGPWAAAVVGDGEEGESRQLVKVSSLQGLGSSPGEE